MKRDEGRIGKRKKDKGRKLSRRLKKEEEKNDEKNLSRNTEISLRFIKFRRIIKKH